MGALHEGHLSLIRAGAPALAARGRFDLRQSDPVRARRGLRELPAASGARRRDSRARRLRPPVHSGARDRLPAGVRHLDRPRGRGAGARERLPAALLSRCRDGGGAALAARATGLRGVRREGRPAARGGPPAGARPRPADRDPRRTDRARERRARAVVPQRLSRRAPSASEPRVSSALWSRRDRSLRRGSGGAPRCAPA